VTAEPAARERVVLEGRPTDVHFGLGLRATLQEEIAARLPRATRLVLVVDREVAKRWPPARTFPRGGVATVVVRIPAGEASKTRAVLARLQDRMLDLTRDDPVVAVGGGATLDVVGFAAATVRRGLPWIAVPTTVVAMADAAVGGKVAVNHPRGKNLLGGFHPPRLVLADVDFLSTLPDRDRVAGLAEVYKCGRVGDPVLLGTLRAGAPADQDAWIDALRRSVVVKARLVEVDERDVGPRRALNYGHTTGHPLETLLGNDRMRHGEAVAIGMGVAARIAVARGLLASGEATRQDEELRGLGLPTEVPPEVEPRDVLAVMDLDKKRRASGGRTFVLPSAPNGVIIAEDVTDDEVLAALRGP
jgi:3-dehydroquinate synthase